METFKRFELVKKMIYCTKNEVFHFAFLEQMWPNPQVSADFVTFTEEILHGKLHFLCSDYITGCLPDYGYFKNNYKMIAIDKCLMLIQKQYKKLILLQI